YGFLLDDKANVLFTSLGGWFTLLALSRILTADDKDIILLFKRRIKCTDSLATRVIIFSIVEFNEINILPHFRNRRPLIQSKDFAVSSYYLPELRNFLSSYSIE